MNNSEQSPQGASDFSATPSVAHDQVVITLAGTGDMAAVAPLERCLTQVHSTVVQHGLSAVQIDIRGLFLLNSSCLKALVSFIHGDLTSKRSYAVHFVVDARLAWQGRTIGVLRRMAPELVSVATHA